MALPLDQLTCLLNGSGTARTYQLAVGVALSAVVLLLIAVTVRMGVVQSRLSRRIDQLERRFAEPEPRRKLRQRRPNYPALRNATSASADAQGDSRGTGRPAQPRRPAQQRPH